LNHKAIPRDYRAPAIRVEDLMRPAVARCLAAGALLTVAATAAHAEIEKFMKQCDGKMCAFFRASVTIPAGWVEDKEATDYFNAVFLLPKDISFDDAPAKIYAIVRYNREKKPVGAFIPDAIKDWKGRAKTAKIAKLDDLPRAGKASFVRHQFEARNLKEQGYELQAVTSDSDKDGNEYVVTITLSANSQAALKAAEPAYLAILGKY
jgi:hypothetical protein